MGLAEMGEIMKRKQPNTSKKWLDEIQLAIADARETKPFANLIGEAFPDADLFHLAPLVCLKFRGLDYRNEQLRKRVTEGALATYIANSSPDGNDHGLATRPLLAFALCYITSHYVLALIDEQEAQRVLDYCEEQME